MMLTEPQPIRLPSWPTLSLLSEPLLACKDLDHSRRHYLVHPVRVGPRYRSNHTPLLPAALGPCRRIPRSTLQHYANPSLYRIFSIIATLASPRQSSTATVTLARHDLPTLKPGNVTSHDQNQKNVPAVLDGIRTIQSVMMRLMFAIAPGTMTVLAVLAVLLRTSPSIPPPNPMESTTLTPSNVVRIHARTNSNHDNVLLAPFIHILVNLAPLMFPAVRSIVPT